jgi:hypothetical protein
MNYSIALFLLPIPALAAPIIVELDRGLPPANSPFRKVPVTGWSRSQWTKPNTRFIDIMALNEPRKLQNENTNINFDRQWDESTHSSELRRFDRGTKRRHRIVDHTHGIYEHALYPQRNASDDLFWLKLLDGRHKSSQQFEDSAHRIYIHGALDQQPHIHNSAELETSEDQEVSPLYHTITRSREPDLPSNTTQVSLNLSRIFPEIWARTIPEIKNTTLTTSDSQVWYKLDAVRLHGLADLAIDENTSVQGPFKGGSLQEDLPDTTAQWMWFRFIREGKEVMHIAMHEDSQNIMSMLPTSHTQLTALPPPAVEAAVDLTKARLTTRRHRNAIPALSESLRTRLISGDAAPSVEAAVTQSNHKELFPRAALNDQEPLVAGKAIVAPIEMVKGGKKATKPFRLTRGALLKSGHFDGAGKNLDQEAVCGPFDYTYLHERCVKSNKLE